MANPRRPISTHPPHTPILPISDPPPTPLSSLTLFLKRPHAIPILLSIFVLLTWMSLRLQHSVSQNTPQLSAGSQRGFGRSGGDVGANLVRFSALEVPSLIKKDRRGWLVNPIVAAREAGLHGGAQSCVSLHVGEIRPGGVRGNHRHHACNETFILWGAEMKFRLENLNVEDKGYAEVSFGVDEVVIAASPAGTAHALINVDRVRPTFFIGCQDSLADQNNSNTDYNIWKDV